MIAGLIGQLCILAYTNEYEKYVVQNYRGSYAIKEHLLKFWRYQINAALIALAMQFLLTLIIVALWQGSLSPVYVIPAITGFLLWMLVDIIAFSRIKKKIDSLDY